MTRVEIQFMGGASKHGDYAVNFMVAKEDDITMYAETQIPDDAEEDYGYFALRQAIIQQAEASGIAAGRLSFFYDGHENLLSKDASASCKVVG